MSIVAPVRPASGRPIAGPAKRRWTVGPLDVLYLVAIGCALTLGAGAQMGLAVLLGAAVAGRMWARQRY
jgi:hypothetical protein